MFMLWCEMNLIEIVVFNELASGAYLAEFNICDSFHCETYLGFYVFGIYFNQRFIFL